jgi:hypothetical protein
MMATMESSSQRNDLFDPIRKKWVEKNPEEKIRQSLLRQMTEKLGYPVSLIAIEKEIGQLPHTTSVNHRIPKRRADIVVYAKKADALHPVLMIECKAVPLTPKFAQQVIGYNSFVKAPFIALANETQVLTGFFDLDNGIYKFEEGLPHFEVLIRSIVLT